MTGIVLVNKPRGISSNSVANIIKAVTKSKKAGHLGTLDVAGDGLLPVALDKATSLFDYYLSKDKVYKTIFEFGYTTDTLDLEGQVTARDDKVITKNDVLKVLPKFVGRYEQMPPAYSAKKINGQKAYNIARAGGEVKLKPKEIEVYSIDLIREVSKNTFEFQIHCSSGTYIRSICRDIAASLSTYGVMQCILRTKCGDFKLDDAFTLDEVKQGKYKIIPLDTLFDYEEIKVNIQQRDMLLNGVWIKLNKPDGLYKVFFTEDFLGVLEIKEGVAKFKFRFV